MRELTKAEQYLSELSGVSCDVHDRATEAYEWFRHNAGYFDEMDNDQQKSVGIRALAVGLAFKKALRIIDKAMPNIREEDNNGGTNADT